MSVWLTNDTCEPWQGRVHWTLETLDGEVIEGGDLPVLAAPQSACCLLPLDFAHQNGKVDWKRVVFVAELWQGSERVGLRVTPFRLEKDMPVIDPGLKAWIDEEDGQLLVQVETKRLARFVELSLDGADAGFGDNYFDLPAGRAITTTIGLPKGWTVEQAREALRVRSLAQVGPFDSAVASHWKGDLALVRTLSGMAWEGLIQPLLTK